MKQSNRPALITLTVSALLLSAAVAQQNPENQTPPPSGNSGGNSNQNGSSNQNGAGSPSTPGNRVNQGGVGQSSTPSTPNGAPVNSPTVLCNLAGNSTTGTVPGSTSGMNSGNNTAGSAGNTAGSGSSTTGGSTAGSGNSGSTAGSGSAGSAGSGSTSGSGAAGSAGSGSGSTSGSASSGTTAAGTTSTPGSTTTSTPSTASGSGNAASGSNGALNETDRCFIDQAGLSGLFEVQSSSVALNQASDAQVKTFARKMIADHNKANAELKTLGTSLGHKPPTSLDPAKAQLVANMKAQQGKNFDSAYMTAQLTGHEQTVNLFSNYADRGSNAKLKQFAKKMLPILTEHWKMAQQMVGTTSK